MILDTNFYSDNDVQSTVVENEITLSPEANMMIFKMFSRNIYSNPIGSIVREITSNCFDSHIEAGVNFPVIVRKGFEPESEMHYISFIDFGVGLSPSRIKNIFSVMFSSTKRADNEQIGGFGVGSKTPLAYKRSTGLGDNEYDNSYYILTNYNNVKYYYQVYEGNNGPKISLLHEEPTTERNGTEVRVPILMSDLYSFAKECVRQLYYFDNVIFEGFEEFDSIKTWSNILTEEYQIVRAKNFLFRGTEYSEYAHVCLGRVAYPIDFQVLGLSAGDYRLPIAIKLEIGDVNVTASRESLDYSKSTIAMLIKKLDEAKAEIKDMLVKQYENIVSLKQYFNLKTDFGRLEFSNGKTVYVGNLIKQSEIDFSNFKYSFMKMPNDKQLFQLFFNIQTFGEAKKKKRWGSSDDSKSFDGGYKEIVSKSNILYLERDVEYQRKIVKMAYLKSEHGMFHIVSPKTMSKRYYLSDICTLFNVHLDDVYLREDNVPTDTLHPFIVSVIEMQEEYYNIVRENCENYDTLEVPEEFILSRKRGSLLTDEMRKLTIPVMFHGGHGRTRVPLKELFDTNSRIFYGTVEDTYELRNAEQLYTLMFNSKYLIKGYDDYNKYFEYYNQYYGTKKKDLPKGGIMFIQLAVGNIKYMKYCRNASHVSKFKYTFAYRKLPIVEQTFKTQYLYDAYYKLSEFYRDNKFILLDKGWGELIIKVNKYINNLENGKIDNDLLGKRGLLRKYFDIDSIKPDKIHNNILKDISDIQFLENANKEVLNYIFYDRRNRFEDNDLLKILEKVMIL